MLQRIALSLLTTLAIGCGAMQVPTPTEPEPTAGLPIAVSIEKVTKVEIGFVAYSPTEEDLEIELVAQDRSFPFKRVASDDPKLFIHGLGISALIHGEQSVVTWRLFAVKDLLHMQVTSPINVIVYKEKEAISQTLVPPLTDGVYMISVSAEGVVTTIQVEQPRLPAEPNAPDVPAKSPVPEAIEEFGPIPPITEPLKCIRGECSVS